MRILSYLLAFGLGFGLGSQMPEGFRPMVPVAVTIAVLALLLDVAHGRRRAA